MEPSSAGRRGLWIILGAGAYFLHVALGRDSALVENVYSRGFFVGFRWLWDHTLGYAPVPLLYLLIAALTALAALKIFRRLAKGSSHAGEPGAHRKILDPEDERRIRDGGDDPSPAPLQASRRSRPRGPLGSLAVGISRGALLVASCLGFLVFLFYVLWGFNYDRITVERQLHLDVTPVGLATLREEAELTERALAQDRASVPGATDGVLTDAALPLHFEADVRRALVKVLSDAGYPVAGRGRVRPLWPGGWLMRFSSTGFYFPFCGEGYVAANLTPAEKPFVMAHEMVHVYGIADEGAANFLGFLACASSNDPFVRYSGQLAYWEYVFPELAKASRDDGKKVASRLPKGVRADLQAIFENWDRYRGKLQRAAKAVYTRYLKSQGVREGIKSYDRFVSLVAAWKALRARRPAL